MPKRVELKPLADELGVLDDSIVDGLVGVVVDMNLNNWEGNTMNIVVGVVDDETAAAAAAAAAVVDDDISAAVVVDVGLDNWSNMIDDHRLENEMGCRIVVGMQDKKDIGFAEMKKKKNPWSFRVCLLAAVMIFIYQPRKTEKMISKSEFKFQNTNYQENKRATIKS